MTRVWPALWPPWNRTTMSACSDNQSTILPFPSSPHCAPTTTTLAISRMSPATHRQGRKHGRAAPDEAFLRIKDAGYRRKQERGLEATLRGLQPFDIPTKFVAMLGRIVRGRRCAVVDRLVADTVTAGRRIAI